MEGDCDDSARPDAAAGPHLRVVDGPVARPDAADGPPPVRLRREFKGLTVACLQREEVSRQLPGQARSALACIERGDLAGAEQALPGQLAEVIAGPWRDERSARARRLAVSLAAAAVGAAVAAWMLT